MRRMRVVFSARIKQKTIGEVYAMRTQIRRDDRSCARYREGAADAIGWAGDASHGVWSVGDDWGDREWDVDRQHAVEKRRLPNAPIGTRG